MRPASFFHRLPLCLVVGLSLMPAALLGQVSGDQSAPEIDRELIRETVQSLAATVEREYFDPDVAVRVDTSLRRSLAEGRYADAQTPDALARMLTSDLFALTADKHLAVTLLPATTSGPKANEKASEDAREMRGRRSNFGVQRVEILSGNVGYLNITAFYRPEEAREAVTAAMRTLRHADALILDMRNNAGGSPVTVALVMSYLFDEPALPLFEIVPRSGDRDLYTTETSPLPDRNGRRPIYVLTARRTFSAGEGLAFLLQKRQRAEIVGENTAGAANPGRPYPLNELFEVTVPNGRVRGAVSGGNWEGVGVIPDIQVPATEALQVAHFRALQKLLEDTPRGSWLETLDEELKRLEEKQ